MLKLVDDRLRERDISVTCTDLACDIIMKQSYDPAYGARPVRRYIEKNVVTTVSRLIISGKLGEHSELLIDADATRTNLVYSSELKAKRRKMDTDAL